MSSRIINRIHILRSSIVDRLLLLNLLLLLAVAGVVLANLVLSRQIDDTLDTVIDKDVSQVINNAELSRNLSTVFAETHLLLNTFIEREEILHTESRRLVDILQKSLAANTTNDIHVAMNHFTQTLEVLLTQCAVILQMSNHLQTLNQALETAITTLELRVTDLIIARKTAGKDYELFALEQVAAAIPDYRSLLIQVAMQLMNARRNYLDKAPVEDVYEQQTRSLLTDLASNLLAVTTAGDELAQSGELLIADVQHYQKSITAFHQAMRTFQTQVSALNAAQAHVMAIMETLDSEITQATGRIRGQVTNQIRTSRNVTILFSVIIIIILGGVGIYAVKITRPILDLTASATAIAGGNLDAPIDSSGIDEIGQLARSFAHMRDVIRAEMEALEEKNTALLMEITERQRAEEALRILNDELELRVRQRTASMEAANKDLKEFAYVVSHDLKAPLRGISRLSQWLQEDYTGKLDQHGQEQLDLLGEQVKRMDQLIDGVLRYSRAVHGSEHTERIDLNRLVPHVIEMLMPPAQISIRVEGALPTIYGDPTQIMQVFQNLLSNAVKFIDKPNGQIIVGCTNTGAHWTFRVEDNGPGIDARHHDRIFKIFQTNVPQNQRESTGIGLTIVKKIVELHGGRIWVESIVGQGSRFLFTWPKRADQAEPGEFI